MGGGIFDDEWGTYAYPWEQPNPLFHRRRPMHGTVPQDRAFQKMDEPNKKKKTVKIVPVGDGDSPVQQVPEKGAAKSVIVSRFESWDAAATKIQSLFRGYVVRKSKPLSNLRVIRKVEEELELLKTKLQGPAQRQMLYDESKERLRWTEGVMALLLRLDSLQGVHPEVRLIRRALTKELIRFQEAIDGMSTEVSEEDDVVGTEDNNLTKEQAEVMDFTALEGNEFDESDPEEFSALGQDFTSGGAEVCEEATVTGRGEEAEKMAEEDAGRPAPDTSLSGDVRQETASECSDQGEGFINAASDSLLLEPPWLQASQPQPSTDGLSDHALLLQVLEENRKLKDVVGKVLQWGNRKDDVIQNLLSRIEHLEERQAPPDLLHCEESDVPKKNGRLSEKGRKTAKTRYPFGYVDPEGSLSPGSSDWFSDDFLW